MAKLLIEIPGKMPSELAEELEDALAVALGCMGFKGCIKDRVTGNITLFPNNEINWNLHLIYLMNEKLAAGNWNGASHRFDCPACGSSDTYACGDDEEMWQCQSCGHCWEIDDEPQ